jgi:hypothetical protein
VLPPFAGIITEFTIRLVKVPSLLAVAQLKKGRAPRHAQPGGGDEAAFSMAYPHSLSLHRDRPVLAAGEDAVEFLMYYQQHVMNVASPKLFTELQLANLGVGITLQWPGR